MSVPHQPFPLNGPAPFPNSAAQVVCRRLGLQNQGVISALQPGRCGENSSNQIPAHARQYQRLKAVGLQLLQSVGLHKAHSPPGIVGAARLRQDGNCIGVGIGAGGSKGFLPQVGGNDLPTAPTLQQVNAQITVVGAYICDGLAGRYQLGAEQQAF